MLDTPRSVRHRRSMSPRNGLSLLTISPLPCALVGLFFATACGDDEPRFLSLGQLCPELAADICGARNGGCCAPVDMLTCQAAEEAACRESSDSFTREASLNYDSVSAAKQHELSRAALDACGPVPVLASFFEGGLPLAAPCERATQCASGTCSGAPLVCTQTADTPVCTTSAAAAAP